LKANTFKEIEFYLLSHGHYDHFSGISDVLDYCYQKKILINTFYHTLSGMIVKIFAFDFSQIKAIAAKRLIETLDKYSSGSDKIILKRIRIDCERPNIKLNDAIEINILSPNDNDYSELEKMIGNYIGKKTTTKPDANKVSTILKVQNNDEFILLTSDALKTRIGRIEKFLLESKLIIGQVPHHGSEKNHRKEFWQTVNRKKDCIAVFSTGDELADKLPDDITVQDISNLSYKIHSTNQVNGICSVFGQPNVQTNSNDEVITDLADFFLENKNPANVAVLQNDLNGDQTFPVWD
jgi:beta-lactamase superfamily II metal-dependent hydrolase